MKELAMVFAVLMIILSACGAGENNSHPHGADAEHHDSHHGEDVHAEAVWTYDESAAQAGRDIQLTVEIKEEDGGRIEDFEINHEKKLHLIVVSEDLSFFHHIHPEYTGGGRIEITTAFPAAGRYKLISDFIPQGGSQVADMQWIEISGEKDAHEDGEQKLKPDSSLVKTVDGRRIELSMSGQQAGEEVTLNFHLSDEATGEGITKLQPYLGAAGHVVIVSENTEEYLHVHPLDENAMGPNAEFATVFPGAGVYKVWGEFQHEGEIITVPFVVEIEK